MHYGVSHIAGNAFFQMAFGAPMEMQKECGFIRMMLLYGFGVLAGSLGASVFDTESNVVGASGAVFATMGAWFADVSQNWDTYRNDQDEHINKKTGETVPFRPKDKYLMARTVVVFAYAAQDLGRQAYKWYTADADMAAVSIAGHFVGFAGGVLFGCFIIKNDVERSGELYIRWTGISVYMCGIVFAVVWNIFFTYDKRGLCSEDSWSQCGGNPERDVLGNEIVALEPTTGGRRW